MTTSHDILELTCELIRHASITPEDAGCMDLIGARLEPLGFHLEWMPFGKVRNLWAKRGSARPLLVFAGHTDVVPTGPASEWTSHPFEPEVRGQRLYGRGAADMKASLAAMVIACEAFVRRQPEHAGSIAFLLTSDEEGPATDGTRKVIEALAARDEALDWCVVGEPSCTQSLGDTIKHGRRGSLNGHLHVQGVQGHIAYPHLADNPIHRLTAVLEDLRSRTWDSGNAAFPATQLQVSNIQSGTGATNVIPGSAEARFNFRYSTATTAAELQAEVERCCARHLDRFQLDWNHSGAPFLTPPGPFLRAAERAVQQVTGLKPELSTGGGTSDGRFIAPYGVEVIEFGPVNASIHQVDEWVEVSALEPLSRVYLRLMEQLLAPE